MLPHHILFLGRLLRGQLSDPARLARVQGGKLRRLVRHAYRNVPYYQRLMDRVGLKPEDIRGVDDLAMFPLTDRSAFQATPLGERSARTFSQGRLHSILTSGSTGSPLEILMTSEDLTRRNLITARANLASGLRPWHKIGVVALGDPIDPKASWYEHLGLWRRKEISSSRPPEEWLAAFRIWRPDILVGRMSTLRLLAETAAAAGPRSLRPKFVFSSAEMLDDASRRFMADVFGCPVLDYYYSFEAGCLAWECPTCRGYHLSSDAVIVEVLDDGRPAGPGREGEVVITNLHSSAMPLLRYRQGDMVVFSDKEPVCGIRLPLIEHIRGRADDYLQSPGGRKIAPQAVSRVFMAVRGVKKWRVVQDQPDRVRMLIEPGQDYGPETRSLLLAGMRGLVQGDLAVDLDVLDHIPQDPAQKYRSVYRSALPVAGRSPGEGES